MDGWMDGWMDGQTKELTEMIKKTGNNEGRS